MLAIIIGSKGQDGTFLIKHLKSLSYEIIEIDVNHFFSEKSLKINQLDISDYNDVENFVRLSKPSEIYYLAAYHQSSEGTIDDEKKHIQNSYNVNLLYYVNFLEAIKKHSTKTKVFYASSSHIFGDTSTEMQNEKTNCQPSTIYGITKFDAMRITDYYRQKYNLFLTVGILYNHESNLRSLNFVSRKIVNKAVKIKFNLEKRLEIGNLNATIDWGYAGDFVKAFHLILNHKSANDFVISSGNLYKIKDFINFVFLYLGLNWKNYVFEDSKILKRSFNGTLFGDASKLTKLTGWKPRVSLKKLAKLMVDSEIKIFNEKN